MTGLQILKRLFQDSIKPYTLRLLSSFFFMLIVAGTTGLTAWLLDPAIEKIFLDRDAQMLAIIPIVIIATLLVKGIATYIQAAILTEVGQKIIADTQIKMFSKITYADLSWVQKNHSGKIILGDKGIHNIHHKYLKYNFGTGFYIMDRIMGTYKE